MPTLKLQGKLLAAFIFVILFLSGVGLFQEITAASFVQRLDQMMQVSVVANELTVKAGLVASGPLRDVAVYATDTSKTDDRKKIEAAVQSLKSTKEDFAKLLLTDQEKDLGSGLVNFVDSYVEGFAKIFEAIDANKGQVETQAAINSVRDVAEFLREGVNDFVSQELAAQVQERAQIRAQVQIITIGGLILVVLASVAFLVGAVFFVRRVLSELKTVSGELGRLSEGTGDLSLRLPVRTLDEIGILAQRFNVFLDTLSGLISSVRTATESSSLLGENLASSGVETASALEQIERNIVSMKVQLETLDQEQNQVEGRANQLQELLTKLQQGMEHQGSSIVQGTDSTQEILKALSELRSRSEELQKGMDQLGDQVRIGQQAMTEAIQLTRRLGDSSEVIHKFMAVIQETATRTNLLAINASIEAAHAGNSGRGFTIVAQEIRHLAESTHSSSEEIEKSIAVLLSGISDCEAAIVRTGQALEVIHASATQTDSGFTVLRQGLGQADANGQQVGETLSILRRGVEELSVAQREVGEGYAALRNFVQRTARISAETRVGMEEVAVGMREISKEARGVSEAGLKNREVAAELNALISRFKVSAETEPEASETLSSE